MTLTKTLDPNGALVALDGHAANSTQAFENLVDSVRTVMISLGLIGDGWSLDDISGKGVPTDVSEWRSLLTYAGVDTSLVPTSVYSFQDAATAITDSEGVHDLPGIGDSHYRTTIPGWARLGAGHDYVASDNGFVKQHGTLPSPDTTSFMVLAYVMLASTPTADAGVVSLADNAFYGGVKQTTAKPTVGTSGTGNTALPVNEVVPVVFKIDVTNSVTKFYTPYEIIQRGFTSPDANAGEVDFGAALATGLYAADAEYVYGALFLDAAAEMSDADIKAVLEALGWTVTWGTATPDATSGKYFPVTADEWTARGIRAPTQVWSFSESDGLVMANSVGHIPLSKTSGEYARITHAQTVTGQTRKAMKFLDTYANQQVHSADTRLPDLATTSCAMLTRMYVTSATPAGGGFAPYQTWVFGFGPAQSLSVHVSATGVYGVSVGDSQFDGAATKLNADVPALLVYDVTGSRIILYTPDEKITCTYAAQSGKGVHVGSHNATIPAPTMYVSEAALWEGTDAEFTDAEARQMLQYLGYTVAW